MPPQLLIQVEHCYQALGATSEAQVLATAPPFPVSQQAYPGLSLPSELGSAGPQLLRKLVRRPVLP